MGTEIVLDIDTSLPDFVRFWTGEDVTRLVDQVKDLVRRGAIGPGHAMPSVRQLANDLELDASTVAKAYHLLERDGIIRTRGFRGAVIHPDAPTHTGRAGARRP